VSSASLTLRTAGRPDLAGIVEIYNQAVGESATADLDPVSVAGREAWFDAHAPDRHPIVVAEQRGALAGWASLSPYREGRRALERCAELSYYVHADHRRSGVASQLLDECARRCPALGIDVVFAIVLDDNTGSVALLEQLGFARWGHLPGVARFGERRVGHFYYGRSLIASAANGP
jgi:phosphinothricin acetyltransferase